MANPVSINVTPGSGKIVAGYQINEGGEDRFLQRVVPSTAEGEDSSIGSFITIDQTLTRPADTTAYAPDDVWANSTSAPTSGGLTFANASRGSGKSGFITDLEVFGSAAPGTLLSAELWLFDQAVTAMNDNAAWLLSLTDLKKRVARIPFVMVAAGNGTSAVEVNNLGKGFTTVGSADLRGLVKVKNSYTPANAENLTFRLKISRTN